jgi:tRNA threonylcarbamoyladenosine biosynthesis protein TsaB
MELSIDTASALASIALSKNGSVIAERTWRCERNHTIELLPAIDALLRANGAGITDLTAVFVTTGPGMYTGLRVGIAVGKGLAHALGIPMAGVGRLELDAYPHRAFAGDIVAVHQAGRGELAWATYHDGPWRELTAPQLSKARELAGAISERTLFTGEIDEALTGLLRDELGDLAVIAESGAPGRAAGLAYLGWRRLQSGGDEPALLHPVYLRPPAIGPQAVA